MSFEVPASHKFNAAIIFKSGEVIFGSGFGSKGLNFGEICFTTGMTGYQETLTDPSFMDQIVTFTFPHIGNVGCNKDDNDGIAPIAKGLILRNKPTPPSNFRSEESLESWLISHNIFAVFGVDTRAITRKIRKEGSQMVAIVHQDKLTSEYLSEVHKELVNVPEMTGKELALIASVKEITEWSEGLYEGEIIADIKTDATIAVLDFGAKYNILRCLKSYGAKVIVFPGNTDFATIKSYNPSGIFLSNGPGDPKETYEVIKQNMQDMLNSGIPVFGICLGHQLLGLAFGGSTYHMKQGHRGANHPVFNSQTGKVEITSQNHGFAVDKNSLPANIEVTHTSLFDGSVEGLEKKDGSVFSVQYHPEASPGPHDSHYLFTKFIESIEAYKKNHA
ncbi:MAG: glutamine-hydrolyzing carbamoyl-phosphate synthase small subunit [Alphaproteobacteria bacterium]|nr:glutamine-hydrolyzing carbamoyl-phosphate synthase small subunit [Alphaproteobacteria bacterium]OJV12224.1 MAG: carbamoyl phosphate synthase small subunit [Alphaproteobacteria bacterium 33-17]